MTTYMRSCSSANPKIEKATRATGVAMRNSSPSWMMPQQIDDGTKQYNERREHHPGAEQVANNDVHPSIGPTSVTCHIKSSPKVPCIASRFQGPQSRC